LKTEVTTLVQAAGVAVRSESGSVTCYLNGSGTGYVVRFIQREEFVLTRDEAQTLLQQLAYKLMSVASQL
jgi:hypothetical protein